LGKLYYVFFKNSIEIFGFCDVDLILKSSILNYDLS